MGFFKSKDGSPVKRQFCAVLQKLFRDFDQKDIVVGVVGICGVEDLFSVPGKVRIIVCSFRNENDKAGFFTFFIISISIKKRKYNAEGCRL